MSAAPAPVDEYIAPAPAVIAAPASVVEYIAPAPAVYAAPAPVEYIAHAPAVFRGASTSGQVQSRRHPAVFAALAPVVEHNTPAPAVYAAPGVHALLSVEGSGFGDVELPAASSWKRSGGCWVKGAGGTWKRMRLTKKTASSLVRRHGVPHVLHGVRWKRLRSPDEVLVLGLAVIRGDISHCMSMVSFLGKVLGNVLWLLHCPVSPDPCLISG